METRIRPLRSPVTIKDYDNYNITVTSVIFISVVVSVIITYLSRLFYS